MAEEKNKPPMPPGGGIIALVQMAFLVFLITATVRICSGFQVEVERSENRTLYRVK